MISASQTSCIPNVPEDIKVSWEKIPSIPPAEGKSKQFGLAGPTSGVHGNYMMVAGGANFEDGLPWKGGTKQYHDVIYLLKKDSEGKFWWNQSSEKLPCPMAYPSCLSLSQGVLAIGGEDVKGSITDVNLFTFDDGIIKRESLTKLPEALSSAGATNIGNTIYIEGGITNTAVSASFYRFDMENKAAGWQKLPDLPVAMSHSVVVSQSDGTETCVYVIGGRNKTTEIHTFLSAVWKYSPASSSWTKVSDISTGDGQKFGLSAGTGVAFGDSRIILFGGDKGIYFNQTERFNNAIDKATDEQEKNKIWVQKDSLLTNHPGFSKDILCFDTKSGNWSCLGEISGESPATTVAFFWNNTVIIPSGEVRPGIRTPEVLAADLE